MRSSRAVFKAAIEALNNVRGYRLTVVEQTCNTWNSQYQMLALTFNTVNARFWLWLSENNLEVVPSSVESSGGLKVP